MKLFGADKNSGMIRKILDWFGMNFNPKLSSGIVTTDKRIKKQSEAVTQYCQYNTYIENFQILNHVATQRICIF